MEVLGLGGVETYGALLVFFPLLFVIFGDGKWR